MSERTETGYQFPETIPFEPLQPGTTVLVAGPALGPAERVVRELIVGGSSQAEGMLFISTNMTAKKLLTACQQTNPGLPTANMGVVDCSGQELDPTQTDMEVKHISTQSDLTGIGMKFSALYEALYGQSREGRVRTGLISLSSLLMYVDLRKLFRFAQTLSSRIDSADGMGVFAIDPTTHDTQTVNMLNQVADGRIDVRESDGDADGELRIRGLPQQPDGWHPFSF